MSAAPDPPRRTPLETMLHRALDGDTVVLASTTGWPSVVLLPWDEYEYLLECRREHEDRIDAAIAEEALAEGNFRDWDEVMAELDAEEAAASRPIAATAAPADEEETEAPADPPTESADELVAQTG